MNYYNSTINTGDILIRPIIPGLDHLAVFIGQNMVIQNIPSRGEHLATVDEFAAGKPIRVRRTGADSFAVAQRGQKILANPQRYDLGTRNCEHTVYEIVWGVAKSPQFILAAAATIVVGLLLYVALSRR